MELWLNKVCNTIVVLVINFGMTELLEYKEYRNIMNLWHSVCYELLIFSKSIFSFFFFFFSLLDMQELITKLGMVTQKRNARES